MYLFKVAFANVAGTNTASPQPHPTLIVASVNSNQKIFLKK